MIGNLRLVICCRKIWVRVSMIGHGLWRALMDRYKIVTHAYPDVDALCSVWLLKRFGGKRYEKADVVFVSHGETYHGMEVDSDQRVIHVDTGGGRFDHHDSNAYICASQIVLESLGVDDEALERIVTYVNAIDHFDDVAWHKPLSDLYDTTLAEMLAGVIMSHGKDDDVLVDWALMCFDGVYQSLKIKLSAIETVRDFGLEIHSSKGVMLAVQTFNDDVIRVGLKMGYVLVLRRDPLKKYVRIKAHPYADINLKYLYTKLSALDPEATWILHADKKQLLNGSSKDPDRVVTELEFEDIVEELRRL